MNTTNYIRIFRGDDSDALGYQTIVGTIKTDIDLAGCKAVFRFLGFYAEFDPIPEDKKLTIVIPAQASRGFPPGVGYASLKVIDAYGKIRTFTNRIPVIVDTMTPSCGCGEFEVSFSPFPELEPLKIFIGPNADDFDQYTGFLSKIIDRASLVKYGLAMLADAMSEDGGASGKAASPLAVKAAYDAIIKELVDNYYTAEQTEEAIDRVAAYYITYTAAGAAFPTYAALSNATTVYSGGKVRIPTRNDYCVVLADETHGGAEYRYIYAVAEGETTGSWQPQFPVEGVMTVDQTVQKNSQNPVSGGGVWSMLWGVLSALPTGFSSLYDWCVAQLAGKASTADVTLTERYSQTPTFSDWTVSGLPSGWSVADIWWFSGGNAWSCEITDGTESITATQDSGERSPNAVSLSFVIEMGPATYTIIATRDRTDIIGYQLGSQSDKPLASEAEAEALREGVAGKYTKPSGGIPKSDLASAVQSSLGKADAALPRDGSESMTGPLSIVGGLDVFAQYGDRGIVYGDDRNSHALLFPDADGTLALAASQATAGNLAALDASGNPTDAGWTAGDLARYALVTKTITSGAVTLDDRAINAVAVSSSLASLTINFPTATSGKVRDFGLRLSVASGITTAPELVLPQGVVCENADGEVPEIGADGAATILYFTETASGVFLVKGEVVQTITQA